MCEDSSVIDVFMARCDDLVSSKFILADKKISGLIKCIVTNDELTQIIEDCLKNFNMQEEFAKAKVVDSISGNINKFRLILPTDRKKQIAFVFCLLSEFDTKKRDLYGFLNEYYYVNGSTYESYAIFCDEVIRVFKTGVELIDKSLDETSTVKESVRQAEKFFSSDPIDLSPKAVEDIMILLRDFSTLISNDNSLNFAEKNEMLLLSEGLGNAVVTRDSRFIKLIWIGFKNTFKNMKNLKRSVDKIASKLKSLWIL